MEIKYEEYIQEVVNICHSNLENGKNIFITGRNMSGKSEIIKKLIQKTFLTNLKSKVYFIDTTNRNLDLNVPENMLIDWDTEIYNLDKILLRRIHNSNFNTVDCFAGDINNGSKIAAELLKKLLGFQNFSEKLEKVFSNLPVEVKLKANEIKFKFHNYEVTPSSGYQALLRIFVEIFFAYHILKIKIFIIDEIDAHLDNVMCREVVSKLKEVFNDIIIFSTIHSINFFEESFNDDIVVLNGETYTYKVINSSELGGLESISSILFSPDLESGLEDNFKKQIISKLKNSKFLEKEERVYIKRMIDQDEKNEADEGFLNRLKEFDYYITFEVLKEKFLNKKTFNALEKTFFKLENITSDEKIIKNILLKFEPSLGD